MYEDLLLVCWVRYDGEGVSWLACVLLPSLLQVAGLSIT